MAQKQVQKTNGDNFASVTVEDLLTMAFKIS